jgi:hypothetical protein
MNDYACQAGEDGGFVKVLKRVVVNANKLLAIKKLGTLSQNAKLSCSRANLPKTTR